MEQDGTPPLQLHLDELARPAPHLNPHLEFIAATTTNTGLTIQADHDPNWYPKGVKISDRQIAAVPLTRHDWHGDCNYTIHPA